MQVSAEASLGLTQLCSFLVLTQNRPRSACNSVFIKSVSILLKLRQFRINDAVV
jgi:hypothetical protein